MSKVNQASGRKVRDLEECWFWNGTKHQIGYGTIQTNYAKTSGCIYAHQMSYNLYKDSAYRPDRTTPIRHLCEAQDNHAHRGCVNPAHLALGTIAENIADRDANLGVYQSSGADHSCSKFSIEEAKKIQEDYLGGKEYKEIAAELGVNRRTIERICTGQTYGLPDCRVTLEQRRKERNAKVVELLQAGKTYSQISKELGVSGSLITSIKKAQPTVDDTPIAPQQSYRTSDQTCQYTAPDARDAPS